MIEMSQPAQVASAASDERIDAGRRHVFRGLVACGPLLFMASGGAAAAGNAQSADTSSELGTVWWSELISRDVPRAAEFYSRVMGWQTKAVDLEDPSRPATEGRPNYTLFMAGGTDVAGGKAMQDDNRLPSAMWVTYFQVDDVNAAVERALAAGGAVLIAPFVAGSAARVAVVADLEGNAVGLAQPL